MQNSLGCAAVEGVSSRHVQAVLDDVQVPVGQIGDSKALQRLQDTLTLQSLLSSDLKVPHSKASQSQILRSTKNVCDLLSPEHMCPEQCVPSGQPPSCPIDNMKQLRGHPQEWLHISLVYTSRPHCASDADSLHESPSSVSWDLLSGRS